MKAYEMSNFIRFSWNLLETGKEISPRLKGILKVMAYQSFEERKKAGDQIKMSPGASDELIEHAARILEIKIEFQRSLF